MKLGEVPPDVYAIECKRCGEVIGVHPDDFHDEELLEEITALHRLICEARS